MNTAFLFRRVLKTIRDHQMIRPGDRVLVAFSGGADSTFLTFALLKLEDDSFTTAALLTYFPPTRRLSISYAGHEPAWYYQATAGRWSPLEPDRRAGLYDLPLAIDRKARYTHCLQRVTIGDRLLLLTDGILEAPNATGELFGRERLAAILQAAPDHSPDELVQQARV